MSHLLTAEELRSQYAAGRRDFQHAELIGALLARVELRGIDLTGANLVGADLRGANLEGACLTGANLFGAILNAAKLGASLLEGANLQRAQLERADLRYATYNEFTRFNDDFNPASVGMQRGCSATIESAKSDVLPSPWLYRGRRPESATASLSASPPTLSTVQSPSRWMYRGRLVVS